MEFSDSSVLVFTHQYTEFMEVGKYLELESVSMIIAYLRSDICVNTRTRESPKFHRFQLIP